MNGDQLKGKWMQFKGELKKKWGKFTDDDLKEIEGDYEKFAGKVKEHYGDRHAEVQKWTKHWYQEASEQKKDRAPSHSHLVSLFGALLLTATLGGTARAAAMFAPAADSWITAKTKMSLAADGRVKGRQVNVETVKGHVYLRGKVDTQDAKTSAEEITKALDNVHGVQNDLQVVAPSRRDAVEDSDEVVTLRVRRALSNDRAFAKANLGVATNAGVVSLTGEVSDFLTSAKASWDTWKVKGVKSVKNDLTIKEPSKVD